MILRDLLRKFLGYGAHHHQGGLDGPAAVGIMPTGTIIAWHGASGSIPIGWRVCDGGGGTPDLRDRFIKGAQDDVTGGATPGSLGGQNSYDLTHAHGVSFSLTAGGNHAHTAYISISENQMHGQMAGNGGTIAASGQHGHGVTLAATGDFHGHGVSAGSYNALGGVDSRPPFYGLFYAMRIAVGTTYMRSDLGHPWGFRGFTLQALWQRLWSHNHAENTLGQIPVGAVVNYRYGGGTPPGFADCDGGNGTPDLRGKFVITAGWSYGLGAEGGAATRNWYHGHGAYASTDGQGSHGHTTTTGGGDAQQTLNSWNDESYHHTNPQVSHTHNIASDAQGAAGHGLTVSLDPVAGDYDNQPGYVTVRYLKRIS